MTPTPADGQPWPRPLALHMAIQTAVWLSSRAALTSWRDGSLPWRADLAPRAAALRDEARGADPDALARALDAETRRRLGHFMAGVRAYREHARPPRPPAPPCVWSRGSTRLLDYGATARGAGSAIPLLVVPSLINRAHILDLTAERSFLRALAAKGFRPFLVDWGTPGPDERRFTLTDYIAGRLDQALATANALSGRPVGVIGYCMGGLLALALAQRRPAGIHALALLATPWDFHAAGTATARLLQAMTPGIEAMLAITGELPVDMLQAMFTGLDPFLASAKFRRFAAMRPDTARARHFVALEDWLNDGVPLVAGVARECLTAWYVDNAPALGAWTVDGAPVRPDRLAMPALAIIPERDHIVPPASAAALADALPRAERRVVPAGHIGMVAGGRTRSMLITPLARWLKGAAGTA